jgi:hypothetical protein
MIHPTENYDTLWQVSGVETNKSQNFQLKEHITHLGVANDMLTLHTETHEDNLTSVFKAAIGINIDVMSLTLLETSRYTVNLVNKRLTNKRIIHKFINELISNRK